jgi:hypothetical protein
MKQQRGRWQMMLVLCLSVAASACSTAVDVARIAVNAADVAIGRASIVLGATQQAAEDRCVEVVQVGELREKCLAEVRRDFRPFHDALGLWRLARATWDAAIDGGTLEQLAAVRARYCELKLELADRVTIPDWPVAPCAEDLTS